MSLLPVITKAEGLADLPTRIDGKDRFQVAVNISNKWEQSDVAVITNYLAFADALTATPLAYKNNAPILLSHPNQITAESRDELIRLRVKKVYIVGGIGSISDSVIQDLRNIGVSEIIRIDGKDRFEVSEKVAVELGSNGTAMVANGLVFADALSIAPYASVNAFPILLTRNNELPANIQAYLTQNQVHKTVVVGGEGSVGPNVFNQLPDATRIGGADRYEVAANIAQNLGQTASKVYLATGLTFADALTGSLLAAKENAVVLLTNKDRLSDHASNFIKQKNLPVTILGGTGSVKDDVTQTLINMKPASRPVIYIVPHQDDEILTYGIDIRNELSKGSQVHLVLITKGEDSEARDILNGKYDSESRNPSWNGRAVKCQWHNTYHNPAGEHYKHGSLTYEEFGLTRTDEYFRASKALGVPESNIHTEYIANGSYYGGNIKAVIQKYLTAYPNADIRAFSWFDGHDGHAAIGRVIKEMQNEGAIQRYQAKYLMSIYTDRFYPIKKPMELIKTKLQNQNDGNYLVNAINEYKRFDPRNGYYAVGYHSVSVQFDALLRDPYVSLHY